jgi:uncharacterized membrane protein
MRTREEGRARKLMGLTAVAVGVLWMLGGAASEALYPARSSQSWRAPGFPVAVLGLGIVAVVVGAWLLARAKAYQRDTPTTFLTGEEEKSVVEAIGELEKQTSGELHVHLSSAKGDVMEAAQRTFETLGMTGTAERNGILFFVAVPQRKFAVLGDKGIHEKVPVGHWDEIAALVQRRFTEGQFGLGLCDGIRKAGEALAAHFPHQPDDVNELPDSISRN